MKISEFRAYDYGECMYEDFSIYDWVNPSNRRTPEQFPYSYSDFYVWRTFDKGDTSVNCLYTDRMREHNLEKYKLATKDRMTNFGSIPKSREDANEVVRLYFGEDFECVGIIQSVNYSSGYPLGVFCIRKKG